MDLGLCTIAYGGYGRFLVRWAASVAALQPEPAQVAIVLGQKHGLTVAHKRKVQRLLPGVRFIVDRKAPTMGRLRNRAVAALSTEWVQYLSADDTILPWAIEEYERVLSLTQADFISIAWQSVDMWRKDSPTKTHKARIPPEMAQIGGRGFINNQSPFRREFWESSPYMEHDYPNAPFVAGLVESGAHFVKTERPCTLYMRRLDSHCGLNLGRRGGPPANRAEKRQALYWSKDMKRRIVAYYNGGGNGRKKA